MRSNKYTVTFKIQQERSTALTFHYKRAWCVRIKNGNYFFLYETQVGEWTTSLLDYMRYPSKIQALTEAFAEYYRRYTQRDYTRCKAKEQTWNIVLR